MYELAESLSAFFVVVEFQEAELGGPYGGAYELVDFAFIFGVEEEFPILSDVLLKLFFKLYDVL